MKDKFKYTPTFKVPENYFEELDERVMQTVHADKLPKETGFAVPDRYFETFEKNILAQTAGIPSYPKKPSKVLPLYKRRSFAVAVSIAACLAIVVAVAKFSSSTTNLENIRASAISAYIEEGNLDVSSNDIISYFQEEDFDSLVFGTEEISNETISDYLLNNLDDSSLLTE